MNLDIPELLDGLRTTMKDYVTLEAHWKDLKTAKQKVNQMTMAQISDTYDPTIDDIHAEIKKIYEVELGKHTENFWETDANFSSLKDFADEKAAVNENEISIDGEDLAVTGMSVQIIDPYTKVQFVDPVRNSRCNHTYEKSTIEELIRTRKKQRCYYMGCTNKYNITTADLVPDGELKRHLARLKARTAM